MCVCVRVCVCVCVCGCINADKHMWHMWTQWTQSPNHKPKWIIHDLKCLLEMKECSIVHQESMETMHWYIWHFTHLHLISYLIWQRVDCKTDELPLENITLGKSGLLLSKHKMMHSVVEPLRRWDRRASTSLCPWVTIITVTLVNDGVNPVQTKKQRRPS